VQVLNALAERGEATLAELTREVGHGKTAVLRILNALSRQGLVKQDQSSGAYALSWRVLVLAHSVAENAGIRSSALPYMHELRDLTSETVTLNGRVEFERVCIEVVHGLHELSWRTEVGSLAPFYAGATGKMFLATLDNDELEQFFEMVEFRDLPPGSKTSRTRLRKEIAEIRRKGFCYDHDTRIAGVGGLAAPIFDRSGAAAAVLTIGGPTARLENADLAMWSSRLVAAAGELTALAGGTRTAAI
jgi:IclR family acetate operon transcriptional repressor